MKKKLINVETRKIPSNLLVDRFLVPPFSVFDTKQGYWQERKRLWISLGIKSELGRGDNLLKGEGVYAGFRGGKLYGDKVNDAAMNYYMDEEKGKIKTGKCFEGGIDERYGRKQQATSIFDPVVCELTYKWFSRKGDVVLDPFAGGSVRGLIAEILGRHYNGIDLSETQLEYNRMQYEDIAKKYVNVSAPNWIHGDSTHVKKLIKKKKANLIFSCPPYYNLEVYSYKDEDLSNKSTYEEFLAGYRQIIKDCCDLLEDDSFAVFVVGNMRDKRGEGYYDFVGDTIRAFTDCGLLFYNESIIVNVAGTLPIRAPLSFNASRKLGKQHQNYLVFYKGNTGNIKDKFGSYEEG